MLEFWSKIYPVFNHVTVIAAHGDLYRENFAFFSGKLGWEGR
jgi:hypothetical protein